MCSIFFTTNKSGVTYHCQNLDNPQSGILVASFNAPGKYKSIAVSRMTDITYFPATFELAELNDMQKSLLPFFAFYPADGINEHGLSVSIAGSYPHKVTDTKNRKGVFITYLNRLMLDSCKTVDEALTFAKRYYFFDHEGMVTTNHLLIADKFGNSAVIEYDKDGRMQYLISKSDNLVMTNDDVVGVDTSQLNCVRYKAICKQLKNKPVEDYKDCMNILNMVENKTLWSVVMDNKTNTGYIATRGKFNHFYKFNVK
jgi:predicted choloylglycine hydrolase